MWSRRRRKSFRHPTIANDLHRSEWEVDDFIGLLKYWDTCRQDWTIFDLVIYFVVSFVFLRVKGHLHTTNQETIFINKWERLKEREESMLLAHWIHLIRSIMHLSKGILRVLWKLVVLCTYCLRYGASYISKTIQQIHCFCNSKNNTIQSILQHNCV